MCISTVHLEGAQASDKYTAYSLPSQLSTSPDVYRFTVIQMSRCSLGSSLGLLPVAGWAVAAFSAKLSTHGIHHTVQLLPAS